MQIVECFLDYWEKKQKNVNVKDKWGWSILHHACYNCQGHLNEEDIIKRLIDSPNSIVDIENEDKNIPLHYFVQVCIFQFLIFFN